ncbi:MAG: hypothetical protein GEU68_01095 [Actinobacteria bacterium]|nr:hypothetical protein [Actinomycetota bacterium]
MAGCLVAALTACGPVQAGGAPDPREIATREIKVVTTIGQIGDVVKNIAGDRVDLVELMGPGIDPHLYRGPDDRPARNRVPAERPPLPHDRPERADRRFKRARGLLVGPLARRIHRGLHGNDRGSPVRSRVSVRLRSGACRAAPPATTAAVGVRPGDARRAPASPRGPPRGGRGESRRSPSRGSSLGGWFHRRGRRPSAAQGTHLRAGRAADVDGRWARPRAPILRGLIQSSHGSPS